MLRPGTTVESDLKHGAESGATDSVDPRIGRVLQGRYKLLAPIAEGAMGTVYRAERLTLGRPVAIKFMHPQVASDPSLAKRFEVEARAMSCLAHPNCVAVTDFGVDGSAYLVMDIVQGASLRALIERGPVPVARALGIMRQLLAALAHAHSHGIIHRDIKPENVLIESVAGIDDHVRVTDFGLAKLVGSELKLTAGMTLGTPDYMAPELTREGAFDHRVDLYAAGVVLFELLIGRAPFHASEVGAVFLRLLTMPPPLLREVNPQGGFSAELERAVCRSMAKQPADRFASASAMAAALDAVPELRARLRRPFGPAFDPDTIVDPMPVFLREEPASVVLPPQHAPRKAAVAARAAAARRHARVILTRARAVLNDIGGAVGAALRASAARIRPLSRWVAGSRKRAIATVGTSIVLASTLTVMLLLLDGSRPSARPSGGDVFVGPPAPTPAPGSSAMVASGTALQPKAGDSPEGAMRRLLELRRSEPRNAEHAAALARLYVEKRWWAAGLDAVRSAVQIDPRRKTDPALIALVISALQSDKAGDDAAEFLRELGPSARPQLRDAVQRHPSPRVRARAAEIIRSSERKPFLRWFSRR